MMKLQYKQQSVKQMRKEASLMIIDKNLLFQGRTIEKYPM